MTERDSHYATHGIDTTSPHGLGNRVARFVWEPDTARCYYVLTG